MASRREDQGGRARIIAADCLEVYWARVALFVLGDTYLFESRVAVYVRGVYVWGESTRASQWVWRVHELTRRDLGVLQSRRQDSAP